ncbi:MAG: helix-turn-helix transcriptional regulator [bacterium]
MTNLLNTKDVLDCLINNINLSEKYKNNLDYDNLNPSEITNLLLSFNFALYNFYILYYSEDFQRECISNNEYIFSLKLLNTNKKKLFLNYIKKIESKYICAISTINDTSLAKKVEMYVRYKIKESITLENTAEFFHLNKIYFCSKFKEEVGINFMIYVQNERIKKSKTLLCKEYLTIEEISQECGFNSAGYFSRVFKKIEGVSPKEFRESNIKT